VSGALALVRGAPRVGSARAALREQGLVAAGQILAGVGNLAFAFVVVRILDPASFAAVAVFLALYLLIHVPARSLEAGGALEPDRTGSRRLRSLRLGAVGSAGILAVGLPLHQALGLPAALVLALAVTPPLALVLALERGRLYGQSRHPRIVASLLAEPLVRLAFGIPLVLALGTSGAAIAVIGGGLAALAVAGSIGGEPGRIAAGGRAGGRERSGDAAGRVAVAAFLLIALLQSEDLVFANATLAGDEAGRFAVLSTLGGIAAFATSTVPFVLMPRAKAGEAGALGAAVVAAVALGGGAALVVMLAPGTIVGLMFGQAYVGIAPIAAPYLAAMALLGVARVLVANDVATGGGRGAIAVLGAVAAGHIGAMVAIGDSAEGIATATLLSTGGLVVALVGKQLVRVPEARPLATRTGGAREILAHTVFVVAALTVLALGLRLAADRSLWLDEATSWYQSQLPFGVMLDDLRSTDVHPPLFAALHWFTVRVFGDSELGLRALSLAAGTALVPMLFVAGRALYDRRTGLIAATLGALAPILIWYSHEARMYALLALLGLVAIWAQHRATDSGLHRYWLLYVAAAAAVVWTHYFGVLLIAALQLALLAQAWERRGEGDGRRIGWGFALSSIGIVALVAPLVPFALDQFGANQAAGKGFDDPQQAGNAVDNREVSLYAGLTNAVWAIWGYHSTETMAALTALWPLLMLAALLTLGRGTSRQTATLLLAAAAPAALLIVLAVGQPFLFELRFNMTAVPILLLLGARALSSWAPSTGWRWALGGLAALTLLGGAVDQQLNGTNPRLYDFEGALSEVSERAGPDDLLLYSPHFLNNVIDYYAPGVEAERLGDGEDVGELADAGASKRSGRVFVLGSFSDDAEAEAAVATARDELDTERRLLSRSSYPQVRVWEYR
jgi:hypothetical protein